MNLNDLLAAATLGTATLAGNDGTTAQITTDSAARLWVAVSDDSTKLSLGGLPETAKVPVALESVVDDGAAVVKVAGVLRYLLESDEGELTRLCTTPGCLNDSTGSRSVLTRVCTDHLNVIVPGMLPNAGDDVFPGDRESAAEDSRKMRLDAWEQEIDENSRKVEGDRSLLGHLREGN